MLERAVRRRAQQAAQLRLEQLAPEIGERHRRIERRPSAGFASSSSRVLDEPRELVGRRDRTCGSSPACPASRSSTATRGRDSALSSSGSSTAGHEQVLGAEQADAHRAVLERVVELVGAVDVRDSGCPRVVGVRAGRSRIAWSARAGRDLAALLVAVLARPSCARRVDDDDAARAVDHEQVVGLDQLGDVLEADDRGDLVRARDDRGVRGLAARVGDQARDGGLVELRGVRRRQIVRDDDRVGRRRQRAGVAGRAGCAARARTRTRRRCGARGGTGPRCVSNTLGDVVDRAAQRPTRR